MQTLSVEALRQIAQAQVPDAQQTEHFELLDKNRSGSIAQLLKFLEVSQSRLFELCASVDATVVVS